MAPMCPLKAQHGTFPLLNSSQYRASSYSYGETTV